ncbi:hypothetical protein IW262DRAFT_317463 [Armillaria fumosa]|nr:hypothetical protein IW262DRAFT_317463 [Armillaria fumosa]
MGISGKQSSFLSCAKVGIFSLVLCLISDWRSASDLDDQLFTLRCRCRGSYISVLTDDDRQERSNPTNISVCSNDHALFEIFLNTTFEINHKMSQAGCGIDSLGEITEKSTLYRGCILSKNCGQLKSMLKSFSIFCRFTNGSMIVRRSSTGTSVQGRSCGTEPSTVIYYVGSSLISTCPLSEISAPELYVALPGV